MHPRIQASIYVAFAPSIVSTFPITKHQRVKPYAQEDIVLDPNPQGVPTLRASASDKPHS